MLTGRIRRAHSHAEFASPGWFAWVCAVVLGLCGGAAALVLSPLLLILALVAAAVALAVPLYGYRVFYLYLAGLLAGYLFLGKGFAYIGVGPLYVAEGGLALAIGTSALILLRGASRPMRSFLRAEVVLLAVFVAWQVLCTIPYVGIYGQDALRDAALWGYAAFTVLIVLLLPREAVNRLFVLYGKVLPYLLAWLLIAWVFVKVSPVALYAPGSPVPLLALKSGDVGVHLGGAAAYMLLRLDARGGPRWSTSKLWLMWTLWVVDWVAWSASNRAGMLSALLGIVVVALWRPLTRWYRPLLVVAILVGALLLTDFTYSFGSNEISVQQLTANIDSTFGQGSSSAPLEATKEWRLAWWRGIIEYTFGGDYFWMGKGYGINLYLDDGFPAHQGEINVALRSPHNATMSILARSGVPGLFFWLLFLGGFGLMLARRASRTDDGEDPYNARYALWLLAYWLAFVFNSSFDVFLEGPMGGVWFWSLMGFSLVYFGPDSLRRTYASAAAGTPFGQTRAGDARIAGSRRNS